MSNVPLKGVVAEGLSKVKVGEGKEQTDKWYRKAPELMSPIGHSLTNGGLMLILLKNSFSG